MAEARLTWKFRNFENASPFNEQGKTFDEAIQHWPQERIYCIEGMEWEKYAWPGGYPLYYLTKDGGCLCSKCANENLEQTLGDDPAWKIEQVDINYEDTTLYCDNCQEMVESAYEESEDGTSDDGPH